MEQEAIRAYLYQIGTHDDGAAFKTLYRHYFARLLQFAFVMVHAKEPAEEIVNDVFINLWRRRAQLYKIDNPDVYLYVAVKNKALDYLSKNHLQENVDIEKLSAGYLQFFMDPEKILISGELQKQITQAVEQLPARCKLIFKLIREDGLKYKETAAILNLSVKTVEAQMAIAVKKLAAVLLPPSKTGKPQRIKP